VNSSSTTGNEWVRMVGGCTLDVPKNVCVNNVSSISLEPDAVEVEDLFRRTLSEP